MCIIHRPCLEGTSLEVIVRSSFLIVYHKLTSLDPFSITPGDYLTSTLGRFRLTLKAPTCQLQI